MKISGLCLTTSPMLVVRWFLFISKCDKSQAKHLLHLTFLVDAVNHFIAQRAVQPCFPLCQ